MSWQEHLKRGSLALAREDYPFAQTELKLALADVSEANSDPANLGVIYGLLAQSFFKHANFEEAEPFLKKAIELESQYQSGSTQTRDLICLSEILRSKGSIDEAFDCLESTLVPRSIPLDVNSDSGNQEFDALKGLFASAAARTRQSTEKVAPRKKQPQPPAHRIEFQPHHAQHLQTNFIAVGSDAQLEHEYKTLVASLKIATRMGNQAHSTVLTNLIPLIRVSLDLELAEQAEKFIDHAFSIAFGKNHAKQLAIPNASSHIAPEVVIELMRTKSDFHTHFQDYAAAARCLADLMKWCEKHNHLMNPASEAVVTSLVPTFVHLMQKADLYSSARILIKQAIEFEENKEVEKALAIYEKALVIYRQLFPEDHLEIAQVLQLKAAALVIAERQDEANECLRQATWIEDDIAAVEAICARRLARLPDLSFS